MTEVARLSAVAKRLNALGASIKETGTIEELIVGIEQAVQSLSVKFSSSSSSASSVPVGASQAYDAFVEIIDGALQNYLKLSKQVGGLVETQSQLVEKAFQAQKEFLSNAVQSKQPDTQTLNSLLAPLSQHIAAIQDIKEKNRSEKILFNHLSAVSEGIPALGWVTVTPKPAPHVMQMKESAEFYSNRVLKDYKDKDQVHKDWSQSFPKLLLELHDFVKKYYTTGLTWGGAKIITVSEVSTTPVSTSSQSNTKTTASTTNTTPAPTSTPTSAPKKVEPKPPADSPKAKELIALIERLEKNDPQLKELNISGNEASHPDFGVRIGNALKGNTHLQKLFMSASKQNCTSATAIANGLKENKSVEVFHIETNEIAADGTLALVEAMKSNTTVVEWKMANQSTYCGIEIERAIASAFDVNQTIVKFTFHGKDIGVNSIVERSLSRNSEIARQKKRAASGATTTSTPSSASPAQTDSKQDAKPKTEAAAPTGQMAKYIARLEENDPTLVDLELNKNAVCSAKHGALMGKALAKNTHLKKLLLDGTLQDNDSAIEIAKGLKQNHSLEVLSLEENDIGPEGLKAIAEALMENSTLLELRLRSQKKPAGVEAEKAFQVAMEKNESLIKFSCQFKDPGVMNYVNRGITRNTEKARQKRAESTPKVGSGPHMTAMQNAINSLKTNDKNAVEINLNDNLVCNFQFTKELSEALERNTQTKRLLMDSTSQNNESMIALCKSLKVNKTLEVISLEHNDIGPDGFKALAEALTQNTSLIEIRINHQKKPLGNEAERMIAESLDKNKSVCKFSITVKDLGVRSTIDRILTRNTEIARSKRPHS